MKSVCTAETIQESEYESSLGLLVREVLIKFVWVDVDVDGIKVEGNIG